MIDVTPIAGGAGRSLAPRHRDDANTQARALPIRIRLRYRFAYGYATDSHAEPPRTLRTPYRERAPIVPCLNRPPPPILIRLHEDRFAKSLEKLLQNLSVTTLCKEICSDFEKRRPKEWNSGVT